MIPANNRLVILSSLIFLSCTLAASCSVVASTGTVSLEDQSVIDIYEGSFTGNSFILLDNQSSATINAGFMITGQWHPVTVVLIRVLYGAGSWTDSLVLTCDFDGYNFSKTFPRNEGYKIWHSFQDESLFSAVMDSENQFRSLFADHGFIYNLKVNFSFIPAVQLSPWSLNVTVESVELHTFDPVLSPDNQTSTTDTSNSTAIQCYPPVQSYSTPSLPGYYYEGDFFINLFSNPFYHYQLELEIQPLLTNDNYKVSSLILVDERTNTVYLDIPRHQESYVLQTTIHNTSLIHFKVKFSIKGSLNGGKVTVIPVISIKLITREMPVLVKEFLFQPIPGSLHVPLVLFSFSPLIVLVYQYKKHRDIVKVTREK
ncbi:MAG: hypothetical protein ACFFD4_36855 [Candidatus Odinarchaeota archaeon]